MDSLWIKDIKKPYFKALDGNKTTDVVIVGGGIAGILLADKLEKLNIDYILLEAKQICSGVTQNTTAKITLGHGFIYNELINKLGFNTAKLYLEAQTKALNEYSFLCKKIECDFEPKDSYVYSMNNQKEIKDEADALNRLGIKAELSRPDELPFNVAGAVKIKGQAQFNPLKFTFSLAEKLNIYEDTKVLEFTPYSVVTNKGKISCKKIVIATHFPIINKHGGYFIKMYQHRSYVIALKNAQTINGMYVDSHINGLSFRSYKDLLLLGGGSHRTGKNGGNWNELEKFARKYYPNSEIVYRWATQDCMTLDNMPYIGIYSGNTPDMYVATGFNKWGMTSAMASSMILSDLISGKSNKYEKIFSPQRSIFRPQLAINTFETLIGLIKPTAPRCPHLGCALKYNPAEHSWDCSCHGSRFDEKGNLIDNPATDDMEL